MCFFSELSNGSEILDLAMLSIHCILTKYDLLGKTNEWFNDIFTSIVTQIEYSTAPICHPHTVVTETKRSLKHARLLRQALVQFNEMYDVSSRNAALAVEVVDACTRDSPKQLTAAFCRKHSKYLVKFCYKDHLILEPIRYIGFQTVRF